MNRLRKVFLRDGSRKLIALVLAVMLYFAVSSRITKERIINNVPVKVTLSSELAGPAETY